MTFVTTLNKIRSYSPCQDGWATLLKHLNKTKADDEPLNLLTILEANGLDDTLWCLRAVEGKDKEIRLFAVWCARQVQHLLKDERSLKALDVAEKFAKGEASEGELRAAYAASAYPARAAAAATAAAAAVTAAAYAYAAYAAYAAAAYAAYAARAARAAARAAAASAGTKQAEKLKSMLEGNPVCE